MTDQVSPGQVNIDPVTGEPLGSLLDLPGVQVSDPATAKITGIKIGGVTVSNNMLLIGALLVGAVILFRD